MAQTAHYYEGLHSTRHCVTFLKYMSASQQVVRYEVSRNDIIKQLYSDESKIYVIIRYSQ